MTIVCPWRLTFNNFNNVFVIFCVFNSEDAEKTALCVYICAHTGICDKLLVCQLLSPCSTLLVKRENQFESSIIHWESRPSREHFFIWFFLWALEKWSWTITPRPFKTGFTMIRISFRGNEGTGTFTVEGWSGMLVSVHQHAADVYSFRILCCGIFLVSHLEILPIISEKFLNHILVKIRPCLISLKLQQALSL